MNPAKLREIVKKDKMYNTASLNDSFYLHYKGFTRIENLEAYTGLKVLWLEGNGIKKIEGLSTLKQLCTLYLHENCIEEIEGLEGCVSAAN